MKKIICLIISAVMLLVLPCTSFAGSNSSNDDGNSFGGFGNLISGVLESVSENSGELLDSLSDLAGNLSDVLSDAADKAGDALSGIVNDAGDALSDAADGIQDALPEAAQGLQDALSDAGGNIEGSLTDVLGQLSTLISGITNSLNTNGIDVELPEDFNLEDYLDDLYDYSDVADDHLDDGPDFDDNLYDTDDDLDDNDDIPGRPAKIAGGWAVNDETQPSVTEDEAALFASAIQGLLGVNYTPVAVLATQLVAGTNYAFLCTGTTVIPNASPEWYVVTVYADLKGNAAVLSIEDIELDDIEIMDDVDDTLKLGAWKITAPEEPAVLPDKAQAAFEKASAAYVGVGFSPIALLGTQIVAGTNYKVLCFGTRVTKDPITSLYVIDIYEDLKGEAQITNAELFDLTDYIDN